MSTVFSKKEVETWALAGSRAYLGLPILTTEPQSSVDPVREGLPSPQCQTISQGCLLKAADPQEQDRTQWYQPKQRDSQSLGSSSGLGPPGQN